MEHKVSTQWKDGLVFESDVVGFNLTMDAKAEVGGENKGPNPKTVMLSALTGCTGMDVASLLKKMRVDVTDFQMNASATMTDEHPKHYNSIHITYQFTGKDIDENKVKKAVDLSMSKYCGITYMLGKTAKITYDIVLV